MAGVAARLRAFAWEVGALVAGLLRPTQKQHKFGCRRRSTEKRKVDSSILSLTTISEGEDQPSHLR
jgi:hypothetical protein